MSDLQAQACTWLNRDNNLGLNLTKLGLRSERPLFAHFAKSSKRGRSESKKREISRNTVESSERVSDVFPKMGPPWMMLFG